MVIPGGNDCLIGAETFRVTTLEVSIKNEACIVQSLRGTPLVWPPQMSFVLPGVDDEGRALGAPFAHAPLARGALGMFTSDAFSLSHSGEPTEEIPSGQELTAERDLEHTWRKTRRWRRRECLNGEGATEGSIGLILRGSRTVGCGRVWLFHNPMCHKSDAC